MKEDVRAALEFWGAIERGLSAWQHVGEVLRVAASADDRVTQAEQRLERLHEEITEIERRARILAESDMAQREAIAAERTAERERWQAEKDDHAREWSAARDSLETVQTEIEAQRQNLQTVRNEIMRETDRLAELRRQIRELTAAAFRE